MSSPDDLKATSTAANNSAPSSVLRFDKTAVILHRRRQGMVTVRRLVFDLLHGHSPRRPGDSVPHGRLVCMAGDALWSSYLELLLSFLPSPLPATPVSRVQLFNLFFSPLLPGELFWRSPMQPPATPPPATTAHHFTRPLQTALTQQPTFTSESTPTGTPRQPPYKGSYLVLHHFLKTC